MAVRNDENNSYWELSPHHVLSTEGAGWAQRRLQPPEMIAHA